MNLDIFHQRYSPEFFDTHSIVEVDEGTKSVTVIDEKSSLHGRVSKDTQKAEACLKIWNFMMQDTSIAHSDREKVAENISSLKTWIHKQSNPNETYPFEKEVSEALQYFKDGNTDKADEIVCEMIKNGCDRTTLKHLTDGGYSFNLTQPDAQYYLSELKIALKEKNYDVIHFFFDQSIVFPSSQKSLYKLVIGNSPNVYLLEEAKKRAPETLDNQARNILHRLEKLIDSSLSPEEILEIYKFVIGNNLYVQGVEKHLLESAILTYSRKGYELIIPYLIAQCKSLTGSFDPSELVSNTYGPNHERIKEAYLIWKNNVTFSPKEQMEIFQNAILSGNEELFDLLLQDLDIGTIDAKEWAEIWRYVQFSQNEHIIRTALTQLVNTTNRDIPLSVGIQTQDSSFIGFILEHNVFSQIELMKSYQKTLGLANVKILRQLAKKMTPQKTDQEICKDILHKLQDPFDSDQNRLYLNQLLFLSGYPEGLDFLEMIKKEKGDFKQFIGEIQDDYWKWIPYVGHFNPADEKELNDVYPTAEKSYIGRQSKYGHEMSAVTEQAESAKYPTLEDTILKGYAERRSEIGHNTTYKSKRTLPYQTSMGNTYKQEDTTNPLINSRYSLFQNLCNKTWNSLPKDQKQENRYEYSYTLGYKGHNLTRCSMSRFSSWMTTVGWTWYHTAPDVIPKLWGTMEEINTQLKEFSVNPRSSQEDIDEFKALLAEGYWLGCHLMVTERGNSQYFQNWLANMCIKKGFNPPISSNKYPLVDCIALCLPLEEFKANFSSYFDHLCKKIPDKT